MDNVSKALIMAGGVLLAIMIVGLSMFLLSSIRGYTSTENEKIETSVIESFNRYYLSFDSDITGIDALNIARKVENDKENGHNIDISIASSVLNNLADKANIDSGEDLKQSYNYNVTYDSDGYINYISIN